MCVRGHNCSCTHWDQKCRRAEKSWEWLRDLNLNNLPGISKNQINAILKHGLALGLCLNSTDLFTLDNAVQKPLLNSSTHQKICVLVLNCFLKMCKIFQNIFLSTKVYKRFLSGDIARQIWRTLLET